MNRRDWFKRVAAVAAGGMAAGAGTAMAITPMGKVSSVATTFYERGTVCTDFVRLEDTWVVTESGCERAAVIGIELC